MDPTALLILPLVGGYIFAYRWNVCRFHGAREEGHRLYFRAAFYAAWLFLVAILVRLYLISSWPAYIEWEQDVRDAISPAFKKEAGDPATFAIVCAYAFIAGATGWWPMNAIVGKSFWLRGVVAEDQTIEELLHRAVTRGLPVALTMDNKKVYVGFVMKSYEPRSDSASRVVWIMPLMSGYRDDHGKVEFTTFYDQVYAKLELDPAGAIPRDFEIALPMVNVQSGNLFDPKAYREFQQLQHAMPEQLERQRKSWRRPHDQR